MELARVLKNYPSKYSVRFILFVGHEHQSYNEGSMYHLNQVQARGERIKAGPDIGCHRMVRELLLHYYTTLLCGKTTGSTQALHTLLKRTKRWQLEYGIPSLVKRGYNTYSENESYIDHGMAAIANVGGNPYLAPGYHGFGPDYGCGDALYRLDRENMFISTQVSLGSINKADADVLPEPSLRVVASVGSSADTTSDTVGNFPMRAFDGMRSTFWSIATDNFGYSDRWLMADLGLPKAIDRIELDFGDTSSAIATDFQVWVGNDPTFISGSYQVAANITDNTSNQLVLDVDPALTGRWVRYVVTRVAGATAYLDYSLREMRIYGADVPITETKHSAVAGMPQPVPIMLVWVIAATPITPLMDCIIISGILLKEVLYPALAIPNGCRQILVARRSLGVQLCFTMAGTHWRDPLPRRLISRSGLAMTRLLRLAAIRWQPM